jgi:plastocyanin
MDADPICVTHHSTEVLSQALLLGEGNTMGNVFVRVVSGLPAQQYPTPTEPVILDQKGCLYEPHVAGVMVNQTLKILNPDGTLHNVHATPKINAEFNLAMPKFRTEVEKTFDKAEFIIPFKCDVHPWMVAWVGVMDNPFFSVTKADGSFEIKDLPAGKYDIEAWHEKLGTQKFTVEVTADEAKVLDITFSHAKKAETAAN